MLRSRGLGHVKAFRWPLRAAKMWVDAVEPRRGAAVAPVGGGGESLQKVHHILFFEILGGGIYGAKRGAARREVDEDPGT